LPSDPTIAPDPAWFFPRLGERGDALAVIAEDGRRISYATLARDADAAAVALDGAHLAAIELASRYDALTAYLAAVRRGVPVILLGTDAIAKDGRIVDLFRPDAVFRSATGAWERLADTAAQPHPDLAVLLSTSGSTGDPKLVRLSRANIAANAAAIAEYLGLTADDRAITSLPLSYSFGLSVLHSHLSVGAGVALTDESVASEAFWTRFAEAGCTVFAGVPHSYALLERSSFFDRDPGALRLLQQAGGRMEPAAVTRWTGWAEASGRRFFVMYGQTEATARMAYLPPEQAAAHPDCIGRAIPGGTFHLEDAEGAPIEAAGMPGELIYTGPNVMMGYARTAADLALPPGDQTLRTGDIAERTADGLYRIVGRAARFVKLFGLRIGLDDVERALSADGRDVAVAGDDRGLAVAVDGGDAAMLRRDIAARYALPETSIHVVTGAPVPRRENGKPDYAAILAAARAAPPPASGGLRALYTAVARGRPVSDEDSFASLGGDSLAYVQATMEIEALIGDVPDGWESLSLAELEARAVGAAGPRGGLVRLETEVLLRAAAITAIVMLHAKLAGFAGGADLLLLLAGYNLVRFQQARLTGGRALEIVRTFFLNFMLPYLGLLAAYSLAKEEVDVSSYLLVSNYVGRFQSVLEPYWFLEAVFQCMLIVCLLFVIPPVRRLAARSLLPLLLGMFAIAVAARFAGFLLDPPELENRTAESVLYLFTGGMAFMIAPTAIRLILAAIIAALSAASWGLWSTHPLWLIVAFAGMMALPAIRVPSPVRDVARQLAAASFYIYMVHSVVIWLIVYRLHLPAGLLPTAASLLAGWLCWQAHKAWQRRRGGAISE
jgi:acyl-coenzyme A synthetase/AMP-(fatty) acid ligase